MSEATGAPKLRAILVGCGGISQVWLEALRDSLSGDVEVVGMVDRVEECARTRAAGFAPEAWIGTDLDAALAALKPDVLLNCTVPEAHFETTRAALAAGCHVLVEKPATAELGDARRLLEISDRVRRRVVVVQNRRYLEGMFALRRLIGEGRIGRVTTICADFFLDPHFGGFRDEMAHVLLLDMAIHTFDQARSLTGARALSAWCLECNPVGSWYAGGGASAMATFQFSDGVVFSYRGSWCAPGLRTDWNADWSVVGEHGTLRWDGARDLRGERVVDGWDGRGFQPGVEPIECEIPAMLPAQLGHAGVMTDFVRSVRSNEVAPTDLADNIFSIEMVDAAVRSARSGEVVSLGQG